MASSRPPKIDEIKSPPLVGETYRVPSVRRGDVFVPVFGAPHTDVELGVETLHFHVDIRFLARDEARSINLNLDDCEIVEGDGKFVVPAISGHRNEVVKSREMKCLREGPDYQAPAHIKVGTFAQTGLIEDQCEDMRVDKCGKCPHRGTPLGHQPVVDGVVVCPAHLLKWEKATGRMIRKTKRVGEGEYDHVE